MTTPEEAKSEVEAAFVDVSESSLIDGMEICAKSLKGMMKSPKFQEVIDGVDKTASSAEGFLAGILLCIDLIQDQVEDQRKLIKEGK